MIGITGIENKIEKNGFGTAYGAEFMLRKNTGKWTGSAAYGWSYSDRKFANINGGKSYEFDFNRPHSFTININRELKNNWNMSAVWILQSGTPFTPALGKFYTLNPATGKSRLEIIYGDKNSDRMQAYHRLDLGFNHTVTTKKVIKLCGRILFTMLTITSILSTIITTMIISQKTAATIQNH